MNENKAKEIRVPLTDKAYVRNGEWEALNWREINSRLGLDTNNAEPLYLKNAPAETNYGREVLMTFSIEEFKDFEYTHIFLLPSFTSVDSSKQIRFDLFLVEPDSWNGNTVTWNSKPTYGMAISRDNLAGGMCRTEITDAVTWLLKAGKTRISFAMVVSTEDGAYNNCLNPKTVRLVATNQEEVWSFEKNIIADSEENDKLWQWADKVYSEWYGHYQKALEKTPPNAEKIESDPKQFNKTVYTAKSGFAPNTGWTDELVKKYSFPTRTYSALDDLGKYSDYGKEPQFDIYGGLMDEERRQAATGFFYSKKIDGRWWFIDPLGYPFYVCAMHAVRIKYLGSPNQEREAIKAHGSKEGWEEWACDKLKNDWYFNVGDSDVTTEKNSIVQQRAFGGFAYHYGRKIGTNSSNGGSTIFSQNNTMPVFDPGFSEFADETSKKLTERANDSNLLGYTTDNELPMDVNMLYNYLTLDYTNPVNKYSYACAWNWLCNVLKKDNPEPQDITEEIVQLFRGFVWDRYFYVVTTAMRKYDPNHMILGARCLTHVKNAPWVLRFASMYLDGMTVNWYGQWEADADDLKQLCTNADLPLMVTEFYTKAMENAGGFEDPPKPLTNTRGAGWVVPTQADRGDFYQNFTLRLLECKNFVGWHWHQYIDDDPSPEVIFKEDGKTWRDQSNIDANKGIVDNRHIPYEALVSRMAQINKNVYRLIDHFDAKYKRE